VFRRYELISEPNCRRGTVLPLNKFYIKFDFLTLLDSKICFDMSMYFSFDMNPFTSEVFRLTGRNIISLNSLNSRLTNDLLLVHLELLDIFNVSLVFILLLDDS
jgi:hypothetical protein